MRFFRCLSIMARTGAIVKGGNVSFFFLAFQQGICYDGLQIKGKVPRFRLMKHPKFWSRFFLVASILTALVIFWFSAQKGVDSQALSDPLTLRLARILRPDYRKLSRSARHSYLQLLSTVIRKNGHFCEFMLLGFNLMGAVRFARPGLTEGDCRLRAMGIAVLYAASDELHQLFVSERAARISDILIDTAGSLTGTFVMTLCLILLAKLNQRRETRR